ncbi:MAG: endonuclease/exonuclease/phosphatase family protein [Lachnospiraceae bacterium]|nr:endonuclease/exonuclease/phosphatase family protein [Lachnospiraceae bacterium]
MLKKILKIALIVLASVVGIVLIYVAYVFLSYSRLDDNLQLEIREGNAKATAEAGEEYTIITNNVGFGAYTQDFTFFMDGGEESRAASEESVRKCIGEAMDEIDSHKPDFILVQELDTDSTRSYHTDQREIFETRFSDYAGMFANNYHSAYLMYPIFEPHGASNSGLLTLSGFEMHDGIRRRLEISESFSKILDLDRCYSKARVKVSNGKDLVIYNTHMSAYGGSDEIRASQMNLILGDMKEEYDKGNYCVCGGDFNNDFTGDSVPTLNGGMTSDMGWTQPFPTELIPEGIKRCTDYTCGEILPTVRNCDVPYKKGNFTLIVDGFMVSENVEVTYLENIQKDFVYSDHNPVVMKFRLK